MTSLEKSEILKEVLDNKKAEDILLLDVHDKTVLTDYILIATGSNKKQLEQLAHYCEEALEAEGVFKLRIESSAEWILIDYGDLMVHLFLPETRDYYQLEKIWHHGKPVD